nr:Glutathione S-transferase-like protein [Ipomoea batatas]
MCRYSASFVDKKEIPPDQYALEIAGFVVKETSKLGPRPEKPIEIYEFERNGPNFRPKVAQMGGKQQFPYMVDPNTGVAMYESDEIIKYLVGKYGDGQVPLLLSLGLLTGSSYTPSKLPPKPLEIWAYEPSPFCKIVREVLVELELPHILHRYICDTMTIDLLCGGQIIVASILNKKY